MSKLQEKMDAIVALDPATLDSFEIEAVIKRLLPGGFPDIRRNALEDAQQYPESFGHWLRIGAITYLEDPAVLKKRRV